MLNARELSWDEALPLLQAFEELDPSADLCTSMGWNRAAVDVLGPQGVLPVALVDADRQVVGILTLERATASWRTGSPGASLLTWPFRSMGYGFRPRWRAECAELVRAEWLRAVSARFSPLRLDLPRTAADAVVADGEPIEAGGPRGMAGEAVWVTAPPATLDEYRLSLPRRYRKDLDYYYRRIAKSGGAWIDTAFPDSADLDTCFDLHAVRLADKGKTSAYMDPTNGRFLRALSDRFAGTGLRITMLQIGCRPVASCLSVVYNNRYAAFMSGWDPTHRKLDLGRQVLYHQIRNEFETGIAEINLLGGDLAYKKEFGLERRLCTDLLWISDDTAALRQTLVDGVLWAYRGTRRVLRGSPVGSS